jgi:serine phosphatase RsbU (regulator of sigma subunit)
MITSSDILKAKILVVDDKETNLRLLEEMLGDDGYTSIQCTSDPNDVCALHSRNRYDLILLDLQMPGMDGFEVMRALDEIEAGGYLPVLVVTAQPGHKLRALEAGAKDFVSKPFEAAELRARIHNILEVRLLHLEAKEQALALLRTLQELEASNERELAATKQTQTGLLPRTLPNSENYRVHASNTPGCSLRGNFYDFLQPGSGKLMGALVDVSGEGMAAALLSSMVLGALNVELRSELQPHDVMKRLNQLLYEKSLPLQFVRLSLFLLNPNGSGQFIGAGQHPSYVFRASTGKVELLLTGTYVLGMFETASFASSAMHLDKGDVLLMYSDGLLTAENVQGETFGKERLIGLLRQESQPGGQKVEQRLLKALEEFTEGVPQKDDITFVAVEKSN